MSKSSKHPLGPLDSAMWRSHRAAQRKPIFGFLLKLFAPGQTIERGMNPVSKKLGIELGRAKTLKLGWGQIDTDHLLKIQVTIEDALRVSSDALLQSAWEQVKPSLAALGPPPEKEKDSFRIGRGDKPHPPRSKRGSGLAPELPSSSPLNSVDVPDLGVLVTLPGNVVVIIRCQNRLDVEITPNDRGGVHIEMER